MNYTSLKIKFVLVCDKLILKLLIPVTLILRILIFILVVVIVMILKFLAIQGKLFLYHCLFILYFAGIGNEYIIYIYFNIFSFRLAINKYWNLSHFQKKLTILHNAIKCDIAYYFLWGYEISEEGHIIFVGFTSKVQYFDFYQ